jgi:hypothetical protein
MKSEYPLLQEGSSLSQVQDWVREVVRLRQIEDLPDFTNLPNIYLRGRRTTRIPTSFNDVLPSDVVGDMVIDVSGAYAFLLIESGPNLVWARIPMSVSW